MNNFKKLIAAVSAVVMTATTAATVLTANAVEINNSVSSASVTLLAADKVVLSVCEGAEESAYAEWAPVNNATGYNVYVDGTQVDSMLIRQYSAKLRVDAVGLTAGSHTLNVVPVISGKEDSSKAASGSVTVTSYDRSGFGWVNGTSSGAYNEDGTLKSNAVVLYMTEDTKDKMTMDVTTSSKGATTACTGIQEILAAYKKGYETRPLDIRVVGEVTDPSGLDSNSDMKGDLCITGSSDSKRLSCGITIEGIGEDAVFYGFGIRLKNISDAEIRNMAVMLCDSDEGDNYTLQQSCDHIWVHNNDSFYGMAGSDADQAKGDGALDCKKSTYITFSYNHFYDNGKCNLLGLSENSVDDLYITYHHNWYDHSDSRHPRVRFYSAHVYNNYYDGNAKYGIGSTNASSVFAESNYFRNCKYPMLTSMQGTDTSEAGGTFSSEDGGVIKAYGNIMEGQKAFVPYSENSTDYDAYVVTNKTDKVPSTVLPKQTSKLSLDHTYNNFDTSSIMYSYTADNAADVPAIVTAKAGRLNGGDFSWEFNDSVDDESYSVNTELMSALKAYKSSVIAIGSGFSTNTSDTGSTTTPATTTATVTTATTTKTEAVATTTVAVTQATKSTSSETPVTGALVIYCSPNGTGDGKTIDNPTDVLSAISSVQAGGTIYLLDGTYSYSSPIVIDQNNSGSATAYKTISAYPGASVTFDFSGEAVSGTNRGFVLDGSYWHFYNFKVTKAGDNGMLLSGNSNKIEMMVFDDNQDTGLQISRYRTDASAIADWPTNNLVLNCTSKNNCDDASMENADGFAAKLTCGEGNVFDGCMSYNNSDDGWDLFAKSETGPIGVVTIQNCIAFRNGYTEFGEGYGDCDGNGFKLGGSGIGSAHVVINCLAFENLHCGFTDNNNPKLGSLTNCTAFNNNMEGSGKPNVSCYRCTDDGCDFSNMMSVYDSTLALTDSKLKASASNDKYVGTYQNGVYYNSGYYLLTDKTNITNGAKLGTKLSAGPSSSDFVSYTTAPVVGTDFHTAWRNADGSINTNGLYETASTSSYYTMGYHFTNSGSSSSITTTAPQVVTTTTTTTTVATTTAAPIVTTTVPVTTEAPIVTTTVPATTEAATSELTVSMWGDASNDGIVNTADAVLVNRSLSGSMDLSAQGKVNANLVQSDEVEKVKITTIDASYLLNFIVTKITEAELPVTTL